MQKKYTRPQLSIFLSLLRCTIAQMHWDGNVDIVLNLELTSGSISTYNSPLFKYAVVRKQETEHMKDTTVMWALFSCAD